MRRYFYCYSRYFDEIMNAIKDADSLKYGLIYHHEEHKYPILIVSDDDTLSNKIASLDSAIVKELESNDVAIDSYSHDPDGYVAVGNENMVRQPRI